MRLSRGHFIIQKPPVVGSSYDSAAVDYFTRVEEAGGTFDATQFGPTFTEAYTKTAISDFISGLKADNVWNKIKELAMWVGFAVNSHTVSTPFSCKVKGTTSNTLLQLHGTDNFFSESFIGAGARRLGLSTAGRGLGFDTQFLDNLLDPNDKSFGVVSLFNNNGYTDFFGSHGGADKSKWGVFLTDATPIRSYTSTNHRFYSPASTATLNSNFSNSSVLCVFNLISRTGINAVTLYRNGTSVSVDSTTEDAEASEFPWYLFRANNAGTPTGSTGDRIAMYFIGTGMTADEVANFWTRWSTLYTALTATPDYDSDALLFFNQIERLGSNFDARWRPAVSFARGSVNNLDYTPLYTKTAISDLVAGLKADGLWEKIYALISVAGINHQFSGNSSGSLNYAALKRVADAQVYDTYVGRHQPAGNPTGLYHDGSSRRMDLAHKLVGFTPEAGCTFGVYFTEFNTTGSSLPIFGAYIDATTRAVIRRTTTTTPTLTVEVGESGTMTTTGPGLISVSAKDGEQRLYKNGSLAASDTQALSGFPDLNLFVGQTNGITAGTTNTRWAFSFICSFLDATEQQQLSNRLNACLTALGGNLY